MLTMKQIIFASVFVFALLATAAAQGSSSTQSSSLTITAVAADDRVRITAASSVVQLHVEIYAASGEKLFDQELRGGNVFDWHLQDGQGQRLAAGTYVCVVTTKSVSGKLTQKIGAVTIEEKSVSVQLAESPQLSAAQAQTIGPVEENSSWTIPGKDEPQTTTVIAHDGSDGQMIRGRGALTFRIGNFFSGNDQEQMRLTEDGRLGIGTSDPGSKLDVAGTVRAERFLVARPKKTDSANTMASGNTAQAPAAGDSVQPLIAGTGTQDRIAKWTDSAGTLGDSVITESAGNIGIGTPTPNTALEVANGRIVATGSQTLAAPAGIIEIGTTITNNTNQASGIRMRNTFNGNATNQVALDVAPTFAPSASISLARGFISAAFFAPPPGVTITDAYGGDAVNVYSNTGGAVTNGTAFAINSPIAFGSLKPSNQYGLHINNQGIGGTTNSYGLFVDAQSGSANNYGAIFAGGNVGIGAIAPAYKLHVVGQDVRVEGNVPGIFPRFSLNFIGGSADEKRWQNYASPKALNFTSLNDAENAETFWLQVNRGTGTAISSVVLPNGNVGIGTFGPSAKLSVVAPGSTEIAGTAQSSTFRTTAGSLGNTAGDELSLASIGFLAGSNTSLGIRGRRITSGADLDNDRNWTRYGRR
jgi:hypothetical protein